MILRWSIKESCPLYGENSINGTYDPIKSKVEKGSSKVVALASRARSIQKTFLHLICKNPAAEILPFYVFPNLH